MSRDENPLGPSQGEQVEWLAQQVARERRMPMTEARSLVRAEIHAARERARTTTAVEVRRPARAANPIPLAPPASEKKKLAALTDPALASLYEKRSAEIHGGTPAERDQANRVVCWCLWEAQRRGLPLDRALATPPQELPMRASNPVDMTLPRGFLVRRYAASGQSLQNEGTEQRGEHETEDDMIVRLARQGEDQQILQIDDGNGYVRRVRIVKKGARVGFEPLKGQTTAMTKQKSYGPPRASNPLGTTNRSMGTRVSVSSKPNKDGEYPVRHWVHGKIIGIFYAHDPAEAKTMGGHLTGLHHGHSDPKALAVAEGEHHSTRAANPRSAQSAHEAFLDGYIDAALFSSLGNDDEPLDEHYTRDDIAPDTMALMKRETLDFLNKHVGDLAARAPEYGGHDFWLTREGHGAGFWDGDWPEPQATNLTKAAKAYGEANLYIGDDKKIHQMNWGHRSTNPRGGPPALGTGGASLEVTLGEMDTVFLHGVPIATVGDGNASLRDTQGRDELGPVPMMELSLTYMGKRYAGTAKYGRPVEIHLFATPGEAAKPSKRGKRPAPQTEREAGADEGDDDARLHNPVGSKKGPRKKNPAKGAKGAKATNWNEPLHESSKAMIRRVVGRFHVGTEEPEIEAYFRKEWGKNADTPLGLAGISYAKDAHYENYRTYVSVMQHRELPKVRPSKKDEKKIVVPKAPKAKRASKAKPKAAVTPRGSNPVKTWKY